jgi:hypothetical protein
VSPENPLMVSLSNHERRRETLTAALVYTALTIVFTWPLARGLARDVPGDLGDPLLNAWILAWDASHLGRGFWNANIFYPHPLALAYSEHLLPQALTILPVQLVSGNPLLSYNLVFLSTFVLSALGMFLFVREITGNRAAAFVSGVAYAFAPYRVTSIPHLQILSSQWMPFALFGFRRWFSTGSPASAGPAAVRPPKGGHYVLAATAAWLLQDLSCGYYMLFFTPVVIAYLAWEITTRSLWRNRRVLVTLAVACAIVFGVTLAVMLPYFELRQLGFSPRSLEETMRFSADTFALFTADPNLRLWGPIAQAWPKAEGALFPGLAVIGLALVAMRNGEFGIRNGSRKFLRPHSAFLISSLAISSLAILAVLLLGFSIRLPLLKIASLPRAVIVISVIWGVLLAGSPEARRAVGRWLASPQGFFTLVVVFAIVMSWGPSIYARGRIVSSSNLYSLFYNFVPGFDGVRVPARFATILTLALSVLAGLGIAALTRTRAALALAALATVAIMIEGAAMPIPINQNAVDYRRPGLAPLPDSVASVPPVYGFVATLPPSATIIELPLGEPAFDIRYMLYSTKHWRRLVNGYSGGAPKDYERLDQTLQDVLERPDQAWDALAASQASHAIVHEASYTGDRGRRISSWLQAHGAQELAAFGNDRIFRIR